MSASNLAAKNTSELFDDLAEVFDNFSSTLDSVERPLSGWMADNLPPGHRALDIGCGTGRYSVVLANHYEEVVAADPAPNMIRIAEHDRPHPKVTYQVRDALEMTPAGDGVFDVVFAFSCVFHMAAPEKILPHLAALVAPGGALVVFDPERPADWEEQDWHVDYAFGLARSTYDMTKDVETAVNVIRTFTHESWLELSKRNVPLSNEEFRSAYSAALPGVAFAEHVFPGFLTAFWRRPGGDAGHRASHG